MNKETKQAAVAAGVAVGLAGLTAAGYFVFGPNGNKNRKKIKGWSLKMKGEVLERLEKLKDVTPETYNTIIDEVGAKYGKLKHISDVEILEITKDLKKHWKAISRDLKAHEMKGKKVVKGATKTVVKKVATTKKAVKKAVKTTAKAVKTAVKEA